MQNHINKCNIQLPNDWTIPLSLQTLYNYISFIFSHFVSFQTSLQIDQKIFDFFFFYVTLHIRHKCESK